MARFIYPAGGGGSASADIADFIFTNEDENNSKMTLPINKEMTIETTRDDDSDCDININSADDIFINAYGDDVVIAAFNEVRIESNNGQYEWRFADTGCLELPGNGEICNPINSSGDGLGYSTISINPDINTNDNRYIIIDPTAPNHIHIRAGGTQDASSAQLFLGGEQANVSIWDGAHEVYVQSYDSESDIYYNWTFDNTGYLYGPAEGGLNVSGITNPSNSEHIYVTSNYKVYLNGTNGEFLNDPSVPGNQIATIGDIAAVTARIYHGSFYSTQTQSASADNVANPMTLNNTDFNDGVTIVDNSKVTIANAGKYNIAFSAQVYRGPGGGTGKEVNIWLAKNGNPVSNSNTRVQVQPDYPYVVAAWNFFVNASANDYYQIMWAPSNSNISLLTEGAGAHPAIPSVILTVNQVA